jgi:maltooligosyltrehalose trehalohydrolase
MLFQGQAFAASSPFLYFADHNEELAPLIRKGRANFLAQFRSLSTPDYQAILDDPCDERTFERSKLLLFERERHSAIYEMHRDLLRLRREDAVFGGSAISVDGAVLGDEAFVLRFFGEEEDDRLLLVNLGLDLNLSPAPEPLLAPPEGKEWRVLWSSEDSRYGGMGAPPLDPEEKWFLPGRTAMALCPATMSEEKILAARRQRETEWTGERKNR